MNQVKEKIQILRKDINILEGKKEVLTSQIKDASEILEEIIVKRDTFKKAIEVLDIAQQSIRKLIKDGFESVVTNALQTIYGDDFKFEIEFGRRGALQEADFVIKNKDLQKSHNPMNVLEGGGKDIVSLALNSVVLELYQRTNKSPFITDEPCKFVSPEYMPASGMFIQTLNEKMGRQLILVTHKEELSKIADNVIEIEKIKGD